MHFILALTIFKINAKIFQEVISISKIKYIAVWTLVLLWMALIFSFSAQPAEESLQTSGGFSEFLAKLLYNDFGSLSAERHAEILGNCQFIVRKAAHFSVYGMLGILIYTACRVSEFKFYPIISSAICLLYAISDEIHQKFVEGRSGELRDVLIDFSGALTGIVGMMIIFAILNKFLKRGKK